MGWYALPSTRRAEADPAWRRLITSATLRGLVLLLTRTPLQPAAVRHGLGLVGVDYFTCDGGVRVDSGSHDAVDPGPHQEIDRVSVSGRVRPCRAPSSQPPDPFPSLLRPPP